jgi:hypothetical protein
VAEPLQPDKEPNESSSLPEVPESFAPGELIAAEGQPEYGFRNERLPQHYQDVARMMCQKVAQIDMFARIEEVKKSGEGRFYWRSMFDMYFNEQKTAWVNDSEVSEGADDGDIALSYGFNIYQAFGRGFITQVGVPPSIKFIAALPDSASPDANRISSAADAMRKKIEYQNQIDTLAEEVARLFWTDGRVCFYSRWVCDGARFGYEDQTHVDESPEGLGEGAKPPEKKPRQPKGGELMTPYGVLECKVPINMRKREDFPFIQLSYEIDLNSAKAMYPNISATISGGQPGPGEYNFDRTTRISTTQGTRLLAQTGDTVYQLPTWQRTWIRPSFFASIDDEEDRKFFEANFPDGMMVAFVGETYAESRNESMDDHWEVCHPVQGDGQATPAAGYLTMSVQDCFNDMTDLQMETHMKAIPAIYGDKGLFDFAAISKEKAGPGAHFPTKRELEPDEDINHKIFAEPFPDLKASAGLFYQQLMGPIPQFLTGIYPAGLGDADPNNETKGGILALRDASRGQQGVAWKAFRNSYAKSMEQLVRIGAYFRASEAEDGKVKISSPGSLETIVDLEDLHEGNFFCVPDGDESYPRTHEDRQLAYNTLVQAATAGNAAAAAILSEPKNAVVLKDILAIPGLVIPGADETEKQLAEIKQLLEETPIPNQQAMNVLKVASVIAFASGKPAPPKPPPQALFTPSVPIDADFDNHAVELKAGTDWVNSSAGQQAKADNPEGFMNVRLHLLLHKAEMEKQKQQTMTEAVQLEAGKAQAKASGEKPKQPSETIAFKDLGPSGRLQVGKQAGLDLTADTAADLAEEHMTPAAPQPSAPAESEQ